jgi:hypothetical protein
MKTFRWLILGLLVLAFSGTAHAQFPCVASTNVGFQEPPIGNTTVWGQCLNNNFNMLDTLLGGTSALAVGSATPSIGGATNWTTANTGSITITNLLGGFPGQAIRLVCGPSDTFTAIASNANFSLQSTWSCANSTSLTLVLSGTKWTETARGGGGTGCTVAGGIGVLQKSSGTGLCAASSITDRGSVTISSSPTGATESINTVTITSPATCPFLTGDNVVVAGVGVSGYNSSVGQTWTVLAPGCNGTGSFQYTNPTGSLTASGGGTATQVPILGAGLFSAGPNALNGGGTTAGAWTHSGPHTWTGAAPIAVANAGVFSNTTQTLNIVSNINSCNIASLFNTQHGGVGTSYDTEALTGCINIPGTSAAGGFAISGYVANSSATAGGVPIYGQCTSLVANAGCWGANFIDADTAGQATFLNGVESDTNINNTGTQANGFTANGFWTVNNAISNAYTVQKPSGGSPRFWQNGLYFFTGATDVPTSTHAGIFFNPSATGASQNSQGITFKSTNAGSVSQYAEINEDINGVLTFFAGGASYQMPATGAIAPVTQTIANGTVVMTTALISSGLCGSTVTVSAPGTLSGDSIIPSSTAAPANATVFPRYWSTSNNVNFSWCNPTAGNVTPNAETLTWRVVR